MAHLVVDGLAASDGSWTLPILITDMNIQRNLYVRGDLHIGGLMMRLVDEIDVTRTGQIMHYGGPRNDDGFNTLGPPWISAG